MVERWLGPRGRVLAIALLGGLLLSLIWAPQAQGGPGVVCGDSAPQCMGVCPAGQGCIALTRGGTTSCTCRNLGCCVKPDTSCIDDVTALSCLFVNGSWGRFDDCTGGCGTTSGDPNGTTCSVATDCASDNCVDGVCCDTICDAPSQSCNLPGHVGECSTLPAVAPVVSAGGVILIVGTLLVIGGFALLRVRRRQP